MAGIGRSVNSNQWTTERYIPEAATRPLFEPDLVFTDLLTH